MYPYCRKMPVLSATLPLPQILRLWMTEATMLLAVRDTTVMIGSENDYFSKDDYFKYIRR